MSLYSGPNAVATATANTTSVTIAGLDINGVVPGQLIHFGAQRKRVGDGHEITTVAPSGSNGGVITLAMALTEALNSTPFCIDMSATNALSGQIVASVGQVLSRQNQFLGIGTSVAGSSQININKDAANGQNLVRWSIGGTPNFEISQRTIGGVEFLAIRSTNNGGVSFSDAILINRATGALTLGGQVLAPTIGATGGGALLSSARRDSTTLFSSFYSESGFTRVFASETGDLLRLADNRSVQQIIDAAGVAQQIWHAGNFGRPTTAAGIGNWSPVNLAAGETYTPPAGGTWAYALAYYSSGTLNSAQVGVGPGGSAQVAGVVGFTLNGFQWRVQ